jgi:PAS domain S-box-containing protein
MNDQQRPDVDRILVLALTAADATLSQSILAETGFDALVCGDMTSLVRQLDLGAGAVLLTEQALAADEAGLLVDSISRQPSWSDVPVILLADVASHVPASWALDRLGNITVLDRPVRVTTLVSALGAAVRARRHQYELREQLRARALYAAIVESSDDAMITKSLDGTILSWNPGAERLLGFTALEAVGQSILLTVPPERRDEELLILDQLRAGHRVSHYETQRRSKHGDIIDISLSVSPISNDQRQVIGCSSIARDITVRKRSELALQRRGERLRLLWEAAAVLLTADDLDGMMGTLFARIAPHFGLDVYLNYSVAETGDALRLESCAGLSPEDRQRVAVLEFGESVSGTVAARRKARVLSDIQASDTAELQLPRIIGLRAYVSNPLVIDDRLIGTLSFGSRTRSHFEPDELEFLETICHYVTATYDRIRLIRQLREADRRKDEFLATLAHELRNPLAPIRNALTIIRMRQHEPFSLEQARGMMERQLEQMVRLIDDLLDVSRITRGMLELRKERIALDSVISTALDTARPLIDSAGHTLQLSLPGEPVYLDGDPIRLAQILANLLNNAAKYMERGGHITVAASPAGEEVEIRVRDTGMGIPPHALASVFDMFTQIGRPADRTQSGLGIGLTLVRRLVEMHGGSIEARSEGVGRGAEFIVRLPVVHMQQTRTVQQEETPITPGASKCRILVADDNIDSAESMAMMLRLMGGNEVRTVHDGMQAVEEALAFRPDLVLLDIGMPRLNGYDAARQIREQPGGRTLVLVALTGWGQDEDRRQASDAGFDRHFTKPVDPLEIEKLVASLHQASAR